MNSRKISTWVIVGIAVVFSFILLLQFLEDPNENYKANLEKSRKNRDLMYASDEDSPVPDSLKAVFPGLDYYPPKREYRIMANFTRSPGTESYALPQKNGEPRIVHKIGYVDFELQGQTHQLMAFRTGANSSQAIFIPFRDATNSKTTYGGGRYLDTRISNNIVVLDFNLAYNPYCVYDDNYICPIPPPENTLQIPIEAGEKDFSWEKVLSAQSDGA